MARRFLQEGDRVRRLRSLRTGTVTQVFVTQVFDSASVRVTWTTNVLGDPYPDGRSIAVVESEGDLTLLSPEEQIVFEVMLR